MEIANQILDKLIAYDFSREQVNMNRRDESFFKSLGVNPKNNEIRYDSGNEQEPSAYLGSILQQVYPAQKFVQRPIGSGTVNTLSIFLGP